MSKVIITVFDNEETQSLDLEADFKPEFNEDSQAHMSAILMIEALKDYRGHDNIREERKTFAGESVEGDDDSEDERDG